MVNLELIFHPVQKSASKNRDHHKTVVAEKNNIPFKLPKVFQLDFNQVLDVRCIGGFGRVG